MRIGCLALTLLVSWPLGVQAQRLYLCNLAEGHRQFQGWPCPGAEVQQAPVPVPRSSESTYAPPSAADVARIRRTIEETSRRDAQLRAGGRGGSTAQAAVIEIHASACEKAKHSRDQRLYALGPKASIGIRRVLDEEVRRACAW